MSRSLLMVLILLALRASEIVSESEESTTEQPAGLYVIQNSNEDEDDPLYMQLLDIPLPGESVKKIDRHQKEERLRGRQRTFIRNPNYHSANKYYDKMFQKDHIKEKYKEHPLLPHPWFEVESSPLQSGQ
ncbi:uncharacterized protein LOC108041571 [Drosophila rhopaloa]|uniref:Uncharacterized protein LOC108041571 n=1 Tax=Drosophila rhopaloa TaxID=1041015 RepID=A0A6P4EEQ0_DRORH|nr:uncharacterized protein LOC108041571 [Drosophila rhopaloa]